MGKKYPYKIEIDWNMEDKVYFATVPNLPGLLVVGNTYEEALKKALKMIPLFHDVIRKDVEYHKSLEEALRPFALIGRQIIIEKMKDERLLTMLDNEKKQYVGIKKSSDLTLGALLYAAEVLKKK